MNNNLNNQINNSFQNNKPNTSTYSLISSIALGLQLISLLPFLHFLMIIPWIFISLVLAIIGKCVKNDKLSFALIIVDIVLIVIGIILSIIFFTIAILAFHEIIEGCSSALS